MRASWVNLNKLDRELFSAVIAFLNGRLEERTTLEWALRLKLNETISRLALLDLIDSPDGLKIAEPWRSAWRLVEESWNNPAIEDNASTGVYDAQERLRAGDRSGSLIRAIVELVAPKLRVEPFSDAHLHFRKPPKRPRKVEELFSVWLTSGSIVDPSLLDLENLADRSFLSSLALALDAAVVDGLETGRRIGWDGGHRLWKLGELHRVYYLPVAERADGENEPDAFNKGIAPAVKLLHTVVMRLIDIDFSVGVEFVRRWKSINSPIHLRLWAAMSRDSRVATSDELGSFLLSLDDRRFWNLRDYPEIAELRAKRFSSLDSKVRGKLTSRIRKCPPRNQWPRDVDADRLKKARLYWAVRELRRIQIAGSGLTQIDITWLDASLREFPELVQMARFDEGFSGSPKVRSVEPNPDSRFNLFSGEQRLKELEAALSSTRRGWDDDPARGAADWIRQPGNPLLILSDLESIPDGGVAFTRVWDQFGWTHSPAVGQTEDVAQRDLRSESARVLSLLCKLPGTTIRQAIDGVSQWLSAWGEWVTVLPEGHNVWLKVWPIAVEVTNKQQPPEEESSFNTVMQPPGDREAKAIDTLNNPAGKLVGVFLAGCPDLSVSDHPFSNDNCIPRAMRDVIITATGRSELIARYRMIEALPYFLRADQAWTNEYLIAPLIADNSEAMTLWGAIARRTQFSEVLKSIGGPMAERAIDRRLSREIRRSFVFSLIIDCLYAYCEQRQPAVPHPRLQQMIRSLDDEVRAYGAEAVQRFVREVTISRVEGQSVLSPEELFRSAAKPFLEGVWPQERSLSTPGVSRALAHLPAAARDLFVEAVETIERFLVPFRCWSISDYGLYSKGEGRPKLSSIDNHAKAVALLQLLDLTIGKTEGSVVPRDLADALDQIRGVAPDLAENQVFRRLATLTRLGN